MAIKKAYVEIIALLEDNMDAPVSSIFEQAVALASAKTGGGAGRATNFVKDDEGNVVGIQCYYFKKWFSLDDVEFGKKAGSATGFNSMCKVGLGHWTKQQRAYKNAQAALLEQVATGEVAADEVAHKMAELEEAKNTIVELPEGMVAYDSAEELLEAIA